MTEPRPLEACPEFPQEWAEKLAEFWCRTDEEFLHYCMDDGALPLLAEVLGCEVALVAAVKQQVLRASDLDEEALRPENTERRLDQALLHDRGDWRQGGEE